MIEYEVQFARITTTGKIPDRFLNCQTKSSSDPAQAYMGTVYTLVEIISPWFTTSQVGQSIINTFAKTYYDGTSTSDLDNFEQALKKVNENLTQITQNGETNWIGNLNAILAVQIENKIHLAQTGSAEAYIFRDGKTNHLTYGLAQSRTDTHPSKTFSNITSGGLKIHDKVLIANPDLSTSLDLDTLREIVSFNAPNAAALQIAKILKRKKVRAVNLMILELMTPEEASKIPDNNLSDNINLDRPIETVWLHLEKFWQQILKPSCVFCGKHLKIAGQKTSVEAKKAYEKFKNRPKKVQEKSVDDKFQKEFLCEDKCDNGLLKDEEIEYSPELNVHYYEQERKKKNDKWGKVVSVVTVKFNQAIGFLVSIWKNKKKRPYLLIVAAIIILIILGVTISGRKQTSSKMTLLEAQTILKQAQASQKDGKTALVTSDNENAKTKFADCITSTSKITQIDMLKNETSSLSQACNTELDKLTATTRFTGLKPIVAAAQDVKSAFVIGGQVYLMGPTGIYKSTISGGKPDKVASLPRDNGDFMFGTVSGQNIYLYTSAKKVYDYNTDLKKLEQVKTAGAWEQATAINFYTGALYLLDGTAGKIYKHLSTADSFGAGTDYLTSSNAKDGISITIDGSIYTLVSSGDVLKFERGKKLSDFSLKDIPSPNAQIEKPIKLYTDSDTASLYVLDAGENKRVVEFDKDGHFVHQYALPADLNNLTDFSVSVKAKKIWFLNQGSLYEISI